ncbi:hypothetical protein AB0I28_12535 [Phytomonospora sp. NPDC050363]|uniref:hypothetical protein n=1 Tax=Phytomonospora sp. NPDC050363 TaxID=3155642 RepID=UPI0034058E5F
MPGLNKDQQIKTVGEGLAIGFLNLGVRAITTNKLAVEHAWRMQWRDWSKRSTFPSVKADLDINHGYGQVIHDSDRRMNTAGAFKREGQWFYPYRWDKTWSLEECLTLCREKSVSLEEWTDLARLLVEELKDDEVVYAG